VSLYELAPAVTSSSDGYQPGAIGVSLGESWREVASFASFDGCWRPSGSRTILAQSLSVPFNTNRIIRATLEDPFMEWLWIQSDDQVWDGMALKGMLDRQVDVLVPLILRRGPPFVPVIYKELGPNGFIPYGYDELPTEGIIEVRMAGSGGMLVRRKVLEAIADPWFESRLRVRGEDSRGGLHDLRRHGGAHGPHRALSGLAARRRRRVADRLRHGHVQGRAALELLLRPA